MLVMQLFLGQYNSLCPVCSIFLKERKQYLFTSFGETGTHIYDTYTHTHTHAHANNSWHVILRNTDIELQNQNILSL